MEHNKKTQIQVFLVRKRITATFILWALLIVAFAPALSSAETNQAPEGMVYCPLTHTFQPVNPTEEKKKFKPFNEICASIQTKSSLFQEFFIKNPFKQILRDDNKLEALAFDFLKYGKSIFEELPNLPNLPSNNYIKKNGLIIVVSNTYKQQLSREQSFRYHSPKLLARPPTALITHFYTNNSIYQSDELSRRLAPRAPPLFS